MVKLIFHPAACLVLMLAMFHAAVDDARATTVAFIATNPGNVDDAAAEAILYEALRIEPGVTWVDRADIEQVLQEQHLTAAGLTDVDTGARVGQLTGADALVIFDGLDRGAERMHRVRVVDTKTGAVLTDLIRDQPLADWLGTITPRLRKAFEKADQPLEQRRHVSFAGIQNEGLSDRWSRALPALTLLLRSDLGDMSNVVLLERQRLQDVAREALVADVAQELLASSTLVDLGLRQFSETRIDCTIVLTPLAGGEPITATFAVASGTEMELRSAIATRLATELNTAPLAVATTATPEQEAAQLRAKLRLGKLFNTSDEAIATGEALLVLDPSFAHHQLAAHQYVQAAWNTRDKMEALSHYYQARKIINAAAHRLVSAGEADKFHGNIFDGKGLDFELTTDQAKKLKHDIRRLDLDTYETLLTSYAAAGRDPERLFWARLFAISHCQSAEEYVEVSRPLLQQIISHYIEGKTKAENVYPGLHIIVRDLASHCRRTPSWKPVTIAPPFKELADHEDPFVKLLGKYGLIALGVHEPTMPEEALDLIFYHIPYDADQAQLLDSQFLSEVASSVGRAMGKERKLQYARALLDRVERTNTPAILLRFDYAASITLTGDLTDRGRNEMEDRVLAMLQQPVPADFAREAASWMKDIAKERHLRSRWDGTLITGLKGWAKYQIEEVPLQVEGYKTRRVTGLTEPDAGSGGSILLIWWQPSDRTGRGQRVHVTRVSVSNGEASDVGHLDGIVSGNDWANDADFAQGTTYLATTTHGLVMIGKQSVESMVPPGGPTELKAVACVGNSVYVGHDDGFDRFDPQTRTFTRIASHRFLRTDGGPLDAGTPYSVGSILAGPDGRQVYLWVDGNRHHRIGLWRFATETGKLNRVTILTTSAPGHTRLLAEWPDILILGQWQNYRFRPDVDTQPREMKGYAYGIGEAGSFRKCVRYSWIKAGDDIAIGRRLFDVDGSQGEFPLNDDRQRWEAIGWIGHSFYMLKNDDIPRVWRVTPPAHR